MKFSLFYLIFSETHLVLADVQFLQPSAGSQFRARSVLGVSWQDSGKPPALVDFTNYVLNLCAGGNTEGSYVCPIAVLKTGGAFAGSNTATGLEPISPDVGGNSVNGYFLQMESTTVSGVSVYNYSPRFGLSGMRGSFAPQVQAGINALGSTLQGPPSSKDKVISAVDSTSSSIVANSEFAIPYGQQQGTIRYAPMQPQPPSSITAKHLRRQYPTSHVDMLAKTLMPWPTVVTTITQSQTHIGHSRENTASPAPNPKDPMARWLARWKD